MKFSKQPQLIPHKQKPIILLNQNAIKTETTHQRVIRKSRKTVITIHLNRTVQCRIVTEAHHENR